MPSTKTTTNKKPFARGHAVIKNPAQPKKQNDKKIPPTNQYFITDDTTGAQM